MPQVRKPAVAGYFYEADRDKLRERIEWSIRHQLGPGQLVKQPREGYSSLPIVVVPHAGYIYSGPIAAMSFAEIYRFHNPRTFIIVGPNHYGVGSPVAIYPEGAWETPLGTVEIDTEIARELMRRVKYLEPDPYAFAQEHSVEVQVPFIQYIFGNNVKIVPIILWRQSKEVALDLGNAIGEVISNYEPGAVVYVASSDWNHYEPHEVTVEKDMRAIDPVLRLDLDSFFDALERYDVSACGYGAVATAIVAAKRLGVKNVILLRHATSGDTSGYTLETVGYASIAFYR
ncbi:AmmeMemoRadiSam system protein B [Vulcanisaeta thermophila]|uniref:AmmeMemoRadiSam system protein B n=1 Tax=Vulcanisaeta thermophila TaxID=867917 RepID=UPI000852B7AF|nr:AmmeMemoRadiSam system protein B [Vulcanisaeta thermophila]